MTTNKLDNEIEVVEHEEYGWVTSGISRLFDLAELAVHLDNTDMTEVEEGIAAPHGQIAPRHVSAAARTIYAKEFLGFGSVAQFYDHLRINHKLRAACNLNDGWIVDSRVIAAVHAELAVRGLLDVIEAQAKADPWIAKFRRRGRVAHRPQFRRYDGDKLQGVCEFCRREFSGRGIVRHLRTCPARAEAARVADEELKQNPDYLLHVRVESSGYWLELEVNASAPLKAVDEYLRDTWMAVDDCGHLSGFRSRPVFANPFNEDDYICDGLAGEELSVGAFSVHVFDYGSSTLCSLVSVGARSGVPLGAGAVHLMARNLPDGDPEMNSPRAGICGYDGPPDPLY